MSLKDRLNSDFKDALKNRESIRKNVINMVRAAIKQYEVDNRKELDDNGVLDVIAKQIKMRKDALSDFEKGNRADLVEQYQSEIDVLMGYMPEQLTEDEIRKIVMDVAQRIGVQDKKDFGKLMGAVMPEVKGRADGNIVRNIVDSIFK
ncbi:MAG: GatB/YqeY domain-containing protein [Clostridiales bacterium]|nr:GatB/YqeY domain-containing protein [Clostridiales bacterium]